MIDIPKTFILQTPDTPFPNVDSALNEPNGLIAIGGDLSTERLLSAYHQGIFPWYSAYSAGEPILWYSPNPRMVITRDTLHVSRSLHKVLKNRHFEVRMNGAFASVIQHCQQVKRRQQNSTWINDDMLHAYVQLHHQGFAQSIEVYQQDRLVGGLYGVVLGKVFFGESMFSLVSDASKVAFVHLLRGTDYQLVDCQVENPHLKRLGAFNISRNAFIAKLRQLL